MKLNLYKRCFGISSKEVTFEKRGFQRNSLESQQRLEQISHSFLWGYHGALSSKNIDLLELQLDQVEPEMRGFAFEGAGMGLALLDQLTPWNRTRLQTFMKGVGSPHIYMINVGAGWVIARLNQPVAKALAQLDPLLGWLAIDGYGFHEGYFRWPLYRNGSIPKQLCGYAHRVFDQGLGRSLWFVKGAHIREIFGAIANLGADRHADLWSGIGLACAYAGGVDASEITHLRELAQPYQAHLAQGAAFAAKTRQRAGNPAPHTELACQVLCGVSAAAAAEVTDLALVKLPGSSIEPAYEIWRQRIQANFIRQEVNV